MAEAKEKRRTAIAIKYKPGEQAAPQVVAKGQGMMAEKILALARENNVIVHEDPDLVEALSKLDIRQEIPPQLYKVVAEILMFVYRLNKKSPTLNKK